jgi:hypothetical protein
MPCSFCWTLIRSTTSKRTAVRSGKHQEHKTDDFVSEIQARFSPSVSNALIVTCPRVPATVKSRFPQQMLNFVTKAIHNREKYLLMSSWSLNSFQQSAGG